MLLAEPATLQLPRLDWEPRSDWQSVRDQGAKGDGKTDDTAAIQKVLDEVTNGTTVYFPPGKYRITQKLSITGPAIGVLVIGHGRDTTLVWDGADEGVLFQDDGVSASRYIGLTFEGGGKAAVGFNHYSTKRFETEVLHRHLAFRNFTTAGLLAVKQDRYALAETTFDNCLFENCAVGASFTSFNDYNWTFDGCEFRDCGVGLDCHHGNFYARNSHFQNSKVVDMRALPEHGCSLRRCTSLGSQQFLFFQNSVSPFTIQDCHVSGWKNPQGAIQLDGAPVVLFDCSFVDPPSAAAPVQAMRQTQRIIASENTAPGCDELIRGGNPQFRYVLPAGKSKGSLASAERSFFRTTVAVPGKVFDARRDFHAQADGRTDDTAAVQACIDAARAHGKGAIAYLPTGVYVIKETLRITGQDYYVGGSGFLSKLFWKGAEGGVLVEVEKPDHLTLQALAIGNHDVGKMNNGIDVLQQGSGKATHVTYDHVFAYGMYQRQPFVKGMQFRNLGPNEVVKIDGVQGNLRFENCAQATILAGTSFEGSVVVEGAGKNRDGFLGFLTRLSTQTTHGLYVRDNHSVVMSDFYIEQANNGFVFQGSSELPPGQVTLQGGKLDFTVPKDKPKEGTAMTIDDYQGQIFFGPNQFYVNPPNVRITYKGQGGAELTVWASLFYKTSLDLQGDKSLLIRLIGNEGVDNVTGEGEVTYLYSADKDAEAAAEKLTAALDHLRELGRWDLQLNHPQE
ncbi:Pectate lyase superfamily protein [Lignipirellula cremea]|uniref:Pectate lyase superfamily protein n=1 Tax=Lignipirellula cremea TaxID=2528010 RepID=A0A518DLD6_9BACT|nr:Pectate lyase superfamily protein [Lignipirellula cremea]